jgi:hypothetical protein
MREEFQNNDVLFDRLVDGELSDVERRRLLASLDDRPEGWRRCALAFLEAQCWSEQLGELVRPPKVSVSSDAAEQSVTIGPVVAREDRRHGAAWLAMAAGLLAAFTLGLVWRSGSPVAVNSVSQSAQQVAEVIPPASLQAPNGVASPDSLTLWVRDETGKAQPLRVPLVDSQTLDQQLGVKFQTGVPADVRTRLQERGFDVESKRRYAPFWLENGRPMIVPVEDTRIVPVSQSVY